MCGDVRLLCSTAEDNFQSEVELPATGSIRGAGAVRNISQMTGFVPQFDQLHESLTVGGAGRDVLTGACIASRVHVYENAQLDSRHLLHKCHWAETAGPTVDQCTPSVCASPRKCTPPSILLAGMLISTRSQAYSTLLAVVAAGTKQVLENLLLAARLRLPVTGKGQGFGASAVRHLRRQRHREVHKVVGEVMALMALNKVATTVSDMPSGGGCGCLVLRCLLAAHVGANGLFQQAMLWLQAWTGSRQLQHLLVCIAWQQAHVASAPLYVTASSAQTPTSIADTLCTPAVAGVLLAHAAALSIRMCGVVSFHRW